MKFKILYDNRAKPGFESGWGFSCLLEKEGEKIIFDTGWDGRVLTKNMERFGDSPENIEKVVISHSHWDHSGGLSAIRNKNLEVYVPLSFGNHIEGESSSRFKLIKVKDPQKITNGVWTTGELKNKEEEQALVVETKNGLFILVGCSHPGVDKIVEAASNFGKVIGIIGGLHKSTDYDVLEKMEKIVCSHCTAHKKEILKRFPEAYMDGEVGLELELEG